jgi:hypothetical protein
MSRAGRALLEQELISAVQLEQAARQQNLAGGTVGLHLVQAGVVREQVLIDVFVELGFELVDEDQLASVPLATGELLPASLAVVRRVVPVEQLDERWLSVAMADPSDDRTVAEVSRHTGYRLVVKAAAESEMSLALKRLYGAAHPSELTGRGGAHEGPPPTPGPCESASPLHEPGPTPPPSSSKQAGRSRAPVLLEGRYERIPADELPEDADAGYIPLTRMKKRSLRAPAPEAVIRVKTVDLGPAEEPRREPPKTKEIYAGLGRKPSRPPAGPEAKRPSAVPVPPATPALSPLAPRRVSTLPMPPPASTGSAPAGAQEQGAPSAESPPPGGFHKVFSATNRDSAVAAAFDVLADCQRVAFFVVTRGVVEGYAGRGADLTSQQVASVWIPLSSASMVQQVVTSGKIYVGPPGQNRTDALFFGALGGMRGDCLVVPVQLGDRVIALLYGDSFGPVAPPLELLGQLAKVLADVLGRLLQHQRPSRQ